MAAFLVPAYMLLWQGNLEAQWPEHDTITLKVQLWCANFKGGIPDLKLEFVGFVHPNLTPLESIRGPALSVYSEDGETIRYFSEMNASQLGILTSATFKDSFFDHLVFYAMDIKEPKIYARPLVLQPRSAANLESNQETACTQPSAGIKSTSPAQVQELQPKLLQNVVLGALRMRGYKSTDADYDQILRHCYKTVELLCRRKKSADLEVVKEKVEAYLKLFD